MRREPRPAGRAGFTLIELLVVIAILALLAALIAAGIGKVKDAQQERVTTATLTKLQLAVEGQWKAVCDKCRDDQRSLSSPTPQPDLVKVVRICDGDADRASALWMYMNLRRSMPHTFAEARSPVVLTGNVGAGTVTVTLQPSATFSQVQASKAIGDQYTESAALLYMILTQGGRGTNFSLDDAMQGAQTSLDFVDGSGGKLNLPAFKDAFGTYIAYRRFYNASPEINQPPYARAQLNFKDPIDTSGKLFRWGNVANRTGAVAAVFNSPTVTQPVGTAIDFDGLNRLPTVISAGADATDITGPDKSAAFDLTGNTDDLLGYRFGRLGN